MATEKRLHNIKVSYWISLSLDEKIEKYCQDHDGMKKTTLILTAISEFLNKNDIAEQKRIEASKWEAERASFFEGQKILVDKMNMLLEKIGENKKEPNDALVETIKTVKNTRTNKRAKTK